MRAELELIDQIENYLRGKMDLSAMKKFKNNIENDPALKEMVEAQELMMQAYQRIELKANIKSGLKGYLLKKLLFKLGLGTFIVAGVSIGVWMIVSNSNSESKQSPPSKNKQVEALIQQNETPDIEEMVVTDDQESDELVDEENATAKSSPSSLPKRKEIQFQDKYTKLLGEMDGGIYEGHLKNQIFTLMSESDTIIETESGIVFYVPKNIVESPGEYQLLIKEALDPADIILAGLHTMTTSGEMLQTGGMFRVEAFKDGKPLAMTQGGSITVRMPNTDVQNPNMKLWKGNRKENGTVEWEKPENLENFLTPVEITNLDFYPPYYMDGLKTRGLKTDKEYTDSLYYSFSRYCGSVIQSNIIPDINVVGKVKLTRKEKKSLLKYVKENPSKAGNITIQDGQVVEKTLDPKSANKECHIIDPERIRAIWNPKFNSTNIATKEFEERLHYIHQYCSKEVFDLYVKNLDKNLYELDAKAVKMFKRLTYLDFETKREAMETFIRFYNRKETRVNTEMDRCKDLNAYLQNRMEQMEEEWKEEKEKLLENFKAKVKSEKLAKRNAKLYLSSKNTKIPPKSYYGFQVRGFGYYNVDEIVASMYQMAGDNSIKPVRVNVQNSNEAKVMLMPKQFNAYLKLTKGENGFETKIGKDPEYDLLAYAFIDSSNVKYDFRKGVTGFENNIELAQTPLSELKSILNQPKYNRVAKDIGEEFKRMMAYKAAIEQKKREEQRAKEIAEEQAKMQAFRNGIAADLFCDCLDTNRQFSNKPDSDLPVLETDDAQTSVIRRYSSQENNDGFPKILTPNGDGKNDVWPGFSFEHFGNVELKIYTSYRIRCVFQTTDPNQQWDGTEKGVLLPPGQYEYVIKDRDKATEKEVATGIITIK